MALLLCLALLGAPLLSPLWARLFWRTRPLEAGEVRERLLALARAAAVPVRVIRVAAARRDSVPGARILGITARTRCVVLNAPLLDRFRPSDVDAVFAHELGHARGRHLELNLVLLAALILAADGLGRLTLDLPPATGILAAFVAALLLFRFAFGWVCRRFELEADLEAAQLAGVEAHAAALERTLGGFEAARRGAWSHPPLDRRHEQTRSLCADTELRAAFAAAGLRVRIAIIGLFAAALAIQWMA